MSTLLLTSGGIRFSPIADEFIKILPKPLNQVKIAHIITASKMAKHLAYLAEDRIAFKKLNIQYEDIDIEGKNEEELRMILDKFDVIYVQGGDPFYLLRHIKLSGFDIVIKELLKKGKLYVGVSAGSYVACPTLEAALWKRPDRARHGLRDDEPAMNLVNFLVLVHYEDRNKSVVENGIKQSKFPVRILTNNQALFVQDDQTLLVGEGEEIFLD